MRQSRTRTIVSGLLEPKFCSVKGIRQINPYQGIGGIRPEDGTQARAGHLA